MCPISSAIRHPAHSNVYTTHVQIMCGRDGFELAF